MNDDTKLPDWLATPMRPAGGFGATIWAHSDAGWTPRPGRWARREHAELVGQRHQLVLGPTLVARLAVAGRGDERGADPLAAQSRSSCGLALAGVHTKTRSASPVGQVEDGGHGGDAEHLGALAVGGEDLAR
jgi:hypothetical protein